MVVYKKPSQKLNFCIEFHLLENVLWICKQQIRKKYWEENKNKAKRIQANVINILIKRWLLLALQRKCSFIWKLFCPRDIAPIIKTFLRFLNFWLLQNNDHLSTQPKFFFNGVACQHLPIIFNKCTSLFMIYLSLVWGPMKFCVDAEMILDSKLPQTVMQLLIDILLILFLKARDGRKWVFIEN